MAENLSKFKLLSTLHKFVFNNSTQYNNSSALNEHLTRHSFHISGSASLLDMKR